MQYIGSKYTGDTVNGRLEGRGKYTFPTGTVYDGELNDGQLHGTGTLYLTGGSKCDATWTRGIATNLNITFKDGLIYHPEDWKYCTPQDRRFYSEICFGLQPAGMSQLTNRVHARPIPEGCYDVGDGFYNPKDRTVNDYEGKWIRDVEDEEHEWAVRTCRKAWDEFIGYREDDKKK